MILGKIGVVTGAALRFCNSRDGLSVSRERDGCLVQRFRLLRLLLLRGEVLELLLYGRWLRVGPDIICGVNYGDR